MAQRTTPRFGLLLQKIVRYLGALALVLAHQVLCNGGTFTSQTNIHIGAFLPLSRNISEGGIGRGVVPAVKLAARHINSSPIFLKDYRLVVQFYDTRVSIIFVLFVWG
ncbi:hypothetical protein JTE90_009438 [Oedothorax gibbosus]|uniref:Uncharacterized protein n=1 Tax=Oedothorax gibbosus TaxID=931172 RepID=A0AAV6VRV8_9ARAC|nr:hypothetical protein JTE90_009438 [Oedothorax gibbosus]